MDPATLSVLIVALAREAPDLIAKVIGILHKQGRITADEVAKFLIELQGSTGASFFPSLPPAPGGKP